MWQKFVDWLKSFFVKEEKILGQKFSGVIRDLKDERDHIFGETKE